MADGSDDFLPGPARAVLQVRPWPVKAQEKGDADYHVLWRAMKRQSCWRTRRTLSLRLLMESSFHTGLAWAVAIRLHVCRVHVIIGVECGERERAHNLEGRRRCIIAVAAAGTCGHTAKFQAWCVALKEEY